jgi:hypothetical protein
LLSNKYLSFAVIIIISAFFSSCGSDKDTEPRKARPNFEDPAVVLSEAQGVIGENVRFAYKGQFLPDTTVQVAAGEEVETADVWGIKFYLLKLNSNNDLEKVYESDLLEGSFRDAMIQKIKFPDFSNELLYYNSQDYFLGSGGGEVFSYIVNFEDQEIYYAHLFSGATTGISLYLSENTGDNLRNFFVSNFKRDYPGLKMAARDVNIQ